MKTKFLPYIILLLFLEILTGKGFAQNLASATAEGSSTTTSTSFVDVTGASVSVSATAGTKVLVVATFTGRTISGSADATYRIVDDESHVSGEIQRSHGGYYGIGSVVYIFDVTTTGTRTYNFQHKTNAQTLETSVAITAIVLYDGTLELFSDVATLGSPVDMSSSSFESALESSLITTTADGGFYVSASIQSAKTSGGANVVVGEWVLQYKKSISGTWQNLSYAVSRSTSGQTKGVVNLVGALPNDTEAGDYYFKVAHRRASGADQIQTQACNLVSVALGTSSGFFPVMFASKLSAENLNNSLNDVISNKLVPQSNTDLFLHAQYNMRANGSANAPIYDLFAKQGSTIVLDGVDHKRYLSGNTDYGSGASAGLVAGMTSGTEYEIALRHASVSPRVLTTSNALLVGFGLNRSSLPIVSPITVNATQGLSCSSYNTLKDAFDDINTGVFRGDITVMINANTVETASARLHQSGYSHLNQTSSYNSVNIYPTVAGISVSGNFDAAIIDLNGADNVTIDGRVNRTGEADLTISNSSVTSFGASIKFANSAENNTVKYCKLYFSCNSAGTGGVYFASSSSGNGNDNNIIEYCQISNSNGNRPINAIFSSGGNGHDNSGITIRNNNIFNFFNAGSSSYGINISFNSSNWTITNNSFYETEVFAPTGNLIYNVIRANTGSNNIISNNYIGGSAPLCGGSAWTTSSNKAHYFCGLYINGGTACTVQSNTIQNISYTSVEDNPWDGIFINSGNVNVFDNIIGDTIGTGSIILIGPVPSASATITGGSITGITLHGGGSGYITPPVVTFSTSGSTTPATATANISGGVVTSITINSGGTGYTLAPSVVFDNQSTRYSTAHGMIQNSSGTVNIINNSIGSITTEGSDAYSYGFESIYVRGVTGTTTISDNLIGSLSTPNSINTSSSAASSTTKQDNYGIYSASIGTTIIEGNTVANLHNSYSGTNSASRTRGIATISGTNTIQNNKVFNISASSAQSSTRTNASVIGIVQTSAANNTIQSVIGNSVYGLSNTNTTARTDIYGIYYSGPITSTNIIANNFIHSFSFSSSDVGCDMDGIVLFSGLKSCYNNIINLGNGITTGYKVNGIWDESGSGNISDIYFNTVYIGGVVSSGVTSLTSAIWNVGNTSNKNYRNNIFVNTRTGGSSGKHYAIVLAGGVGTLTIDYNDYFATVLGRIGSLDRANLAAWKSSTLQDTNSLSLDPDFVNAGGTSYQDYHISAMLPGVNGTGITTDFEYDDRLSSPAMGALGNYGYVWQGSISNDFGTAANWATGEVPTNGKDIIFSANPDNDCVLDQDRTVGTIVNAQNTYKFIVNGNQLSIKEELIFSNGAQIDAKTSSSKIIFEGTSSQNIPSGAFVDETIYALTVNNTHGLSLNSSITLLQNLTLTSGALTIGANTLTINGDIIRTSGSFTGGSLAKIIIGGSGASTSLPTVNLHSLTLNRMNGLSLGGDVSVDSILVLSSGTLNIGAHTFTFSGDSLATTSGSIDASDAGASLIFANTNPITISSSIISGAINNLTLSGEGGITSSSNLTINGILNLQNTNPSDTTGLLDMWDGLENKTLTMGANATTVGIGDVTGIVKREHVFSANTEYSFGNQYTAITFIDANTKPTWISMKISIGSVPAWSPWTPSPDGIVRRHYKVACSDNSSTSQTNVRMHYLPTELDATNYDESKLVFWHKLAFYGGGLPHEHGKSNQDFSHHFLSVTGLVFGAAATDDLEDSQVAFAYSVLGKNTWKGEVAGHETEWEQTHNWTAGNVPLSTDDVLIPGGLSYYPSLTASANAVANSIEIEAGATLTANSYNITVSGSGGAWVNFGTFYPGTGTVIFNHGNSSEYVTVAGITDFYNINIGANTSIVPVPGCIFRVAGAATGTPTSHADWSAINSTVEWNGTNQNINNPQGIGGNTGYYNLILSGNGTKTMPATALNVHGNLYIIDTAIVSPRASLTISGDFYIGENAVFNTGDFNHSIQGHFDNNGTFNASGDNTITMNGASEQMIGGTAPINFNNLTVDNSEGVMISEGVNITDTLTLNNGNLNIAEATLGINGPIIKLSGNLNVTTISSLSFGGTATLVFPDNLFTSSPSVKNLTINKAGGVSLSNQDMIVNDTMDLLAGALSIGANTLTFTGSTLSGVCGSIDASDASATIVFANIDEIILPENVFSVAVNNLTLSGSGCITAVSDFTINGILNLQNNNPSSTKGCLDMWDGSAVKTLTMGIDATTVGIGDVTGIVKRTAFALDTDYTFGNQFTVVHFASGGTYPTQLQTKISIGTAPSWKSSAINRCYDFVQTGGDNCFATITTHYDDSELNGNSESDLVHWTFGNPGPPLGAYEWGKSDYDLSDNFVTIENINIGYFPTSFGQLENTLSASETPYYTWNGLQSTTWISVENWSPKGIPSATSNVIIPDAATTLYSPILPISTEIFTLSLEAGALVRAISDAQLLIKGSNAWVNNGGSFYPSTSHLIFASDSAYVSGTADFYNITIPDTGVLMLASDAIIRISGSINNEGILNTTANPPTTVEYNGDAQNVIVPDSATNRYYNLILSGSGEKTLPDLPFSINGDFTLSGTASTFATKELTIDGNLFMESGTSFSSGNTQKSENRTDTIYVKGDWINEGLYNAGEGTVIFDSPDTQIIHNGNNSFYNLVINKPNTSSKGSKEKQVEEVILGENISLYSLSLLSGKLNLGANILTVDNKNPNAITKDEGFIYADTLAGASESYSISSKVKWVIGDTSGITYSVPFGMSIEDTIPFAIEITKNEMDENDGYIEFSTYSTNEENYPVPDIVDHLGDVSSYEFLVNRYWYVNFPKVNKNGARSTLEGYLSMTYLENELDNVIEASMMAQRYNSDWLVWADVLYTQNDFTDMPIYGGSTIDEVNNVFKTSYIDTAQFFNIWVLTNMDNPLPIKLLSFEAECINNSIEINWSTATETNNHYFTIEKSVDAVNWVYVTNVNGNNNTSTENNYSFKDNNTYESVLYYRLSQTDNDGLSEKFNPVAVNPCIEDLNDFSVFPNPFSNMLTIFVDEFPNAYVQINVYDALGELVRNRNIDNSNVDDNSITLDLSTLSNGVYYVGLVSHDNVRYEKVIKQN